MKSIHIDSKRKYCMIIIIILLCILAVLAAYAWFSSIGSRFVDTESLQVDEPPILYILDSDTQDMVQLDIKNLMLGSEKQLIFCIASKNPVPEEGGGLGKTQPFSLQLCYTNNMGAEVKLKKAEFLGTSNNGVTGAIQYTSQKGNSYWFKPGEALDYTDISTEGNKLAYGDDYSSSNNKAKYYRYDFDVEDGKINNCLQFADNNLDGYANTSLCRFYVLDIDWNNADLQAIDSKETDIVYIVAKGGKVDE